MEAPGDEFDPSRDGVAFIGFGALAEAFARGLRRAGVVEICASTRAREDPTAADALRRRLKAAGVRTCPSIEDAIAGASMVVGAVPAGAAAAVAAEELRNQAHSARN